MLEMLLDKKLLFVLMGMLTGLGVADKCIVSMTMKRMIEAYVDYVCIRSGDWKRCVPVF